MGRKKRSGGLWKLALYLLVVVVIPLFLVLGFFYYGPLGWTPLHILAKMGLVSELLPWLDGAEEWWGISISLDAQDKSGHSPLHVAALGCSWKSVEALVQAGSRVNLADSVDASTPLHLAVRAAPVRLPDHALARNLVVLLSTVSEQTAAEKHEGNCHRTIETLIAHGALMNAKDSRSRTPFSYAILLNKPLVVQLFLSKRVVFPGSELLKGDTPVHLAAQVGHAEVLRVLLEHRQRTAVPKVFYDPSLMGDGDALLAKIARAPADQGKSKSDSESESKSESDIESEFKDQREFLVESRHQGDLAEGPGESNSDRVVTTVRWHVDVETVTGFTPLHMAAASNCGDCVALLLQAGADISHRRNALGFTALHTAAHHGKVAAVKALLLAGAALPEHINRPDDVGSTALREACSNGHVQVAAVLLASGSSDSMEGGSHMERATRVQLEACVGRAREMLQEAKTELGRRRRL